MNKNEIIDYCLDNHHLTESELKQGLLNRLNVSTLPAYNHNEKSVKDACGLTNSKLFSSDGNLAAPNIPEERIDKVSMVVEYMEEIYNKRELAYLFVHTIKALESATRVLEILKRI